MSKRAFTPRSEPVESPTPLALRSVAVGSTSTRSPWPLLRLMAILVAIAESRDDVVEEAAA
jgi:hypothetical protein